VEQPLVLEATHPLCSPRWAPPTTPSPAAAERRSFDWIAHFADGVSLVDTANGWVQGIDKNSQSLGVRVISPAQWTATTGSQTALHNDMADPDGWTFWVRVRPAAPGDLALTGSLAGVAARNAAGAPVRAALFGAGRIADQGGTRELLSSWSARSIEADLQGAALAITGDSIVDFHAYSLSATSVTLNGTASRPRSSPG
jgi:hypothetical protein